MKKSGTCAKCGGRRVGQLTRLADKGQSGGSRQLGYTKGWIMYSAAGGVEAYICADCGYFEEYLKSPENMPWDQLDQFRWLNEDEAG